MPPTTLKPLLFINQELERPTRFHSLSSYNSFFSDQKCIIKSNNRSNSHYLRSNVVSYPRFPVLNNYSTSSLRTFLPLCSRPILPHPSLCFLFQFRSPPIRSPFSIMTTNNQSTPDPALQSTNTKTVRVVIKGRVQGVFYRNWTVENANQLGLKGWVRNRRDGSVEALFSGDSDKVQEMEQRCRRGPPDAMVTGLQVFPSTDDPGTAFLRKSTV